MRILRHMCLHNYCKHKFNNIYFVFTIVFVTLKFVFKADEMTFKPRNCEIYVTFDINLYAKFNLIISTMQLTKT